MKKTAYMRPLIEVVEVDGNALMEIWSVGIDNDPGHSINPGDEEDIGAKEGSFEYEDWGKPDFNS